MTHDAVQAILVRKVHKITQETLFNYKTKKAVNTSVKLASAFENMEEYIDKNPLLKEAGGYSL